MTKPWAQTIKKNVGRTENLLWAKKHEICVCHIVLSGGINQQPIVRSMLKDTHTIWLKLNNLKAMVPFHFPYAFTSAASCDVRVRVRDRSRSPACWISWRFLSTCGSSDTASVSAASCSACCNSSPNPSASISLNRERKKCLNEQKVICLNYIWIQNRNIVQITN